MGPNRTNNMNVHKNAYSGGIKKRIGGSDLKERNFRNPSVTGAIRG